MPTVNTDTAFSPEEALNANVDTRPQLFIYHCLLAAVSALIVGAIIDNIIRCIQERCTDKSSRTKAFLMFSLQLIINIVILLMVARYHKGFLPWLQLSASGLIFSVLVFAVQDNLLQNTLIMTKITLKRGDKS